MWHIRWCTSTYQQLAKSEFERWKEKKMASSYCRIRLCTQESNNFNGTVRHCCLAANTRTKTSIRICTYTHKLNSWQCTKMAMHRSAAAQPIHELANMPSQATPFLIFWLLFSLLYMRLYKSDWKYAYIDGNHSIYVYMKEKLDGKSLSIADSRIRAKRKLSSEMNWPPLRIPFSWRT